jgi:dTDP-4-dehydrorhamnose reductase
MKKEKVLVLGAGGIIGQHLLISCPDWVNGIFTRKTKEYGPWISFNTESDNIIDFLDSIKPDVIINLAGENRVDIVESEPSRYYTVNVRLPQMLSDWASMNKCYLIQCSSQGVFSGNNPTYSPNNTPNPITHYGRQKVLSEKAVLPIENSEIARFTFVLGVRPFQNVGRRNPLEDMIENSRQQQVNDRFFSPLFVKDCAEILWERVKHRNSNNEKIVHLGSPIRCSRFTIATDLKSCLNGRINPVIEPVPHEYFAGIAPRPIDTTWNTSQCIYESSYEDGLISCFEEWNKLKSEYK